MKANSKEWFVSVPWGKICMIAWGNPKDYPVLLYHGLGDSAATFLPLLKYLPENYYYVSLDLPGHSKSDPFPKGIMALRFLYTLVLDIVLKNLRWTEFYFIGHSLGAETGLFYNAIYPNRIKKLVLLDPVPAIHLIRIKNHPDYMTNFYQFFYDTYDMDTNYKIYTHQDAFNAVMKARKVSMEQAAVLLSRNLIKVGDDQYQLILDKKLRISTSLNLEDDYYVKLFSMNSPPTLMINAMEKVERERKRKSINEHQWQESLKLMKEIQSCVENFTILDVVGDHNVHFKKPESFAKEVSDFMKKPFNAKAKL